MFEKYDGVRGFWNPLKRSFYSRTGKRIELPQAIIEALPRDLFLDGELWCVSPVGTGLRLSLPDSRYGRENFQEAMKLVHKTAESNIDWARFKYMVFDIPTHSGTYEERYNLLGNLGISCLRTDFIILKRIRCEAIRQSMWRLHSEYYVKTHCTWRNSFKM